MLSSSGSENEETRHCSQSSLLLHSMGVNYNYTRLSNTLRLYTWWNSCTETNDPRHCTLFLQAQGTSLSSIYAFNVYIQTTRNLVFNTLDVKQHMVALQHSIRSDSVTHSAKIFPETLCVRLSRATLLHSCTQCGQPLRDSVGPLLHWRHFWRSAWALWPGWRLIFCPNYLFYYMTDTSVKGPDGN